MRLPVIQYGVTLFRRERSEKYMPHLRCRYRLAQEAVSISVCSGEHRQRSESLLLKYQTKRRLEFVSLQDFVHFLKTGRESKANAGGGAATGGLGVERLLEMTGPSSESGPSSQSSSQSVSRSPRIRGLETCGDEVGPVLVVGPSGLAVVGMLQARRLLIQAEESEVEMVLRKAEALALALAGAAGGG